jgi:tetratricopeptide (TPR) repeat protein
MEEGVMYAMVYDYDNVPISGVEVFIDNIKYTESDINGRFIIGFMLSGIYSLKLSKPGYETINEELKFNPMNVLYLKLINSKQLLTLAENSLDQQNYIQAEIFINRALLLEPNRPDILFLKSIILYLQKKYIDALELLAAIKNKGFINDSILKLYNLIEENM